MIRIRPPCRADTASGPAGSARLGGAGSGTICVVAMVMACVATAACGGTSPSGGGPSGGGSSSAPATNGAAPLRPSAFGPPALLGDIVDERVTESSGLVASRRHPGRLWTHNDSDTPPLLSCVEPDGRSCGGWTVDGARNVDWEDIAAGPGPQPGEHYLYVGDIGDNVGAREDVVVYRLVEPAVPDPPGADGTTSPATAIRLRFDDGPRDAESLMVHPTSGDIYLITKQLGDTGVYRAPPNGGVLTRVATLGLGLFGLATGADISPDGRRVALSTPIGGFELTLDKGSGFDDIWSQPPVPVTFPPRAQGESVAYRLDGDALLLTSEGYPSPLYEVPRL